MPIENRDTNIELLRLISMFLVLCVHADFLSLGIPNLNELNSNPVMVWFRSFIESLSIVCVNVFVMISGWFGIKASVKGLSGFVFQCLYFSLGLYFFSVLKGESFSIGGLFSSCLMSSYWFVPAYIGLYILSPALNSFLRKYDNKQIFIVLLLFYSFQTVFGLTGVARFVEFGYSCFSFIGLYLLSGFIRKIYNHFFEKINKVIYVYIYVLSSIIITILFILEIKFGINLRPYSYINPIVILSSISLLLFFVALKIRHNKFINFISSGIFAVYLLHLNKYCGKELFISIIQTISENLNDLTAIFAILIFLISVMIISTILDQPRKLLWYWLSKNLNKRDLLTIQ